MAVTYITKEQLNTSRDRILTDRQMAQELHIPLSSLRGLWAKGKGPPAFKSGRHKRGLYSTLIQWAKDQSK